MILQIERMDGRTYIDGITSINVYYKNHYEELASNGVDHSKTTLYAFDRKNNLPDSSKIRLFRCYNEVENREWFIATNCVVYLLSDKGKTIARYAENTLS